MRLVENSRVVDIYSQKVKVELTVGELVMMKYLSGKVNSEIVAGYLRHTEHDSFSSIVLNQNSNKYLYQDLENITHRLTKGLI